jgi:hypothetical protein
MSIVTDVDGKDNMRIRVVALRLAATAVSVAKPQERANSIALPMKMLALMRA